MGRKRRPSLPFPRVDVLRTQSRGTRHKQTQRKASGESPPFPCIHTPLVLMCIWEGLQRWGCLSFMNFLPKAQPASGIHTRGNGRTWALLIAPTIPWNSGAGFAGHSHGTSCSAPPQPLAFPDLIRGDCAFLATSTLARRGVWWTVMTVRGWDDTFRQERRLNFSVERNWAMQCSKDSG